MLLQIVQISTLLANILMLFFIIYYLSSLHKKEKIIEQKEEKLDSDYHHVVNDALAKERKILDDATAEANYIVSNAKYTSETSKQLVHQALQKMIEDVHHETLNTAKVYIDRYHDALTKLSGETLQGFNHIAKGLETDLQKQITDFRANTLTTLEKELQDYKGVRMQQTEELIKKIVGKVSQDVLHKTLTVEDHHQLMVDALDRAKKEGMFS